MAQLSNAGLLTWLILAAAGFVAAVLNTLAGGGPLITLGAMIALGMDPKTANITSTIALFPGQILTGWAARAHLKPLGSMVMPLWFTVTVLGGAIGGALIAIVPNASFASQVPYLVLFATSVYAWQAIRKENGAANASLPAFFGAPVLFILSLYGGYFGGGNSFLVLALLASMGLGTREAGGVKNLIVALINGAAVVILLPYGAPNWFGVSAIATGGMLGGVVGGKWLSVIQESHLRALVIGIGLCLTIWLFIAS
jgi:uncharacterized protein